MRPRYQRSAIAVAVNTELPAFQILTIFRGFRDTQAARVQLICEADRGGATCGNGNFLRIGTGAVVQLVDAAVSMSQLLHIVGACGQTSNRDLAAGIGGVGTSSQRGAGTVGIDPKLPAGKIFAIFCRLGQAQTTQIRRVQLEISIGIAIGGTCQRNGRLVGRAGHIPNVIGRCRSGRDRTGSPEYGRFRDVTGLCNVQGIAAPIKFSAVTVCKAPVRKNTIAVIDRGFIPGQSDGRRIGTGTACEAGPFYGCLNIGNQGVIIGCEIGDGCHACVVEDIASGAALICGIEIEGAGISQTAYDLIDQKLCGNSQGDVGVGIPFYREYTHRIVPHLIAVQQDQTNGIAPGFREGIPHTAARGAAAAGQGHIPVNGITGGTSTVGSPGLNAVQRIICIRDISIPGKMPA